MTSMSAASTASANPAKGRDYRIATLLALVAAVVALGYGISLLSGSGVPATTPGDEAGAPAPHGSMGFSGLADARQNPAESYPVEIAADPKDQDLGRAQKNLRDAEAQIKAKQFNEAILTLTREVDLMRKYPESYIVLGQALEGRKEPAAARDFYRAAIDRDPYLADAYWGFATASESLKDLESALGAMRSFLHNVPVVDKNQLRIAQARSAIWEWESQLGRGPWGPTKGVPPGFSAEEIKRDGRGVGIKMPVPGTEGPDGKSKAEIKHGKKFELFKQ